MPKISRPIVYTALAAVAAYALFLNTQPDTATTKRTVRITRTAAKPNTNDILPEDLSAHFPRYQGNGRNSFAAGVVVAKPRTQAAAPRASGIRTGWTLTGISSVNGVASALIENGGTGESVFLQPGDRWNGLSVVAIRPNTVVFKNGLGREDLLTFTETEDEKSGGSAAVPAAPRLPGLGPIQSLAPYPVTPLRVTPLARAAAPLPPLQGAPGPSENNAPPPPDSPDAQ